MRNAKPKVNEIRESGLGMCRRIQFVSGRTPNCIAKKYGRFLKIICLLLHSNRDETLYGVSQNDVPAITAPKTPCP
jgi:hypothetical protein